MDELEIRAIIGTIVIYTIFFLMLARFYYFFHIKPEREHKEKHL